MKQIADELRKIVADVVPMLHQIEGARHCGAASSKKMVAERNPGPLD